MRTEKRFEELIRTSSNRAAMPPMDRVQRRMVHEMAKFYNLDTESFDNEPNRTVTVTKRKDSKM
jgi:predicted RNA-binding protein Jag